MVWMERDSLSKTSRLFAVPAAPSSASARLGLFRASVGQDLGSPAAESRHGIWESAAYEVEHCLSLLLFAKLVKDLC